MKDTVIWTDKYVSYVKHKKKQLFNKLKVLNTKYLEKKVLKIYCIIFFITFKTKLFIQY